MFDLLAMADEEEQNNKLMFDLLTMEDDTRDSCLISRLISTLQNTRKQIGQPKMPKNA